MVRGVDLGEPEQRGSAGGLGQGSQLRLEGAGRTLDRPDLCGLVERVGERVGGPGRHDERVAGGQLVPVRPVRTWSRPSTTVNVSVSNRCRWAGGPECPGGTTAENTNAGVVSSIVTTCRPGSGAP